MKYLLFAVKDKALDSYSAPFAQATIEAGLRMWRDLVMFGEAENRYRRSPDDFCLYHIGEYDDETGELTNENEKTWRLSTATEVINETRGNENES